MNDVVSSLEAVVADVVTTVLLKAVSLGKGSTLDEAPMTALNSGLSDLTLEKLDMTGFMEFVQL